MKTYLCLLAAIKLSHIAGASPWLQQEGDLYSRIAASSEQLDGFAAVRTGAYAEYGVNQDWTVTLKAEAVRFDEDRASDNESVRITARRALFSRNGYVGAVEGGVLRGGSLANQNSCETMGVETRLSLGWSGELLEQNTFTFAELAGRYHEGCERQRAEFGFGQQATKNIWLINQAWFERGSEKARSDKIQTELLWRTGDMDFSIGYREELGGKFLEEAVFVSVVRRF